MILLESYPVLHVNLLSEMLTTMTRVHRMSQGHDSLSGIDVGILPANLQKGSIASKRKLRFLDDKAQLRRDRTKQKRDRRDGTGQDRTERKLGR